MKVSWRVICPTLAALCVCATVSVRSFAQPAPANRDLNKEDHSGTLPDGNQKDRVRKEHYCKVFSKRMVAGRIYLIDLVSGNGHIPAIAPHFDTWLRIEGSAMNTLAENDDSNGTYNSQIVFKPTRTNDYRIVVTTYAAPTQENPRIGTGPYNLRIVDFPERAEYSVTRQGAEVKGIIDDFHVGDREVLVRRAGNMLPPPRRRITRERQANPYLRRGTTTYCNVFVSDVTSTLGGEFPRMKDGEEIVANDMYDWAAKEQAPAETGWYPLPTGGEFLPARAGRQADRVQPGRLAQQLANQGMIVVAIWKNPRRGHSGHTAIVVPHAWNGQYDHANGPKIAQAGGQNHNLANAADGFHGVPLTAVRYFYRYR